MQYDTIEELTLELALYPNRKIDILEDCAKHCKYGWFAIAKDGNCSLFDDNGELDDINKVKSIDEDMVPKDIQKISIPDNVISIGNYAFYDCRNLINVMIPNSVANIGECAFRNCISLVSITIPNSVLNIGYRMFEYCGRLTSVTIPDSVDSIRDRAFAYCIELTNVIIPDNVKSIGLDVFFYCSNLKELIFKSKTLEEVQSMKNYPFGIKTLSIIKCER